MGLNGKPDGKKPTGKGTRDWSLGQETGHKEGTDGDNAHRLALLDNQPSLTRAEPDNVVDSTRPSAAFVAKSEKDRPRFKNHGNGQVWVEGRGRLRHPGPLGTPSLFGGLVVGGLVGVVHVASLDHGDGRFQHLDGIVGVFVGE